MNRYYGMIILIAIVVLGVGCFFALNWDLNGACKDTVSSESESPDHALVATVFVRNCGATADYSTIVSIRKATEKFNPKAQEVLFLVKGKVPLQCSWTSTPIELVIKSSGIFPQSIFKKTDVIYGTTIRYDGLNPPRS